jgi:hypothetical protein
MAKRSEQAATADELQEELRDLLSLAVVGDHVRWVLVGDEVSGMAQWLANAAGQWREYAEQVSNAARGGGCGARQSTAFFGEGHPFELGTRRMARTR